MLDKIKKFFTNKLTLLRELDSLNVFKLSILKKYHSLKCELVLVNRENKRKELEKQLIYEINVLADLLNEEKININNIAETLTAYPNKI